MLRLRIAVLLLLGTLLPTPSFALWRGIGAGGSYSVAMGYNYATLNNGIGFNVHGWFDTFGILPKEDYSFHGTIGFMPMTLRNASDLILTFIPAMFGVEYKPVLKSGIRPFVSVDLGAVFSFINFGSVTNTINFSVGANFGAQFRPGFSFPLTDKLSLDLATPFMILARSNPFTSYSANLDLRWEF